MIAITIAALAVAVISIVAVIVERRTNDVREKAYMLERGALLQRIQAPEYSVAQYAREQEPRELVFNVPFDDDEAFQEAAAKRRRMSDGAA